jgi:hypothetical protein
VKLFVESGTADWLVLMPRIKRLNLAPSASFGP